MPDMKEQDAAIKWSTSSASQRRLAFIFVNVTSGRCACGHPRYLSGHRHL